MGPSVRPGRLPRATAAAIVRGPMSAPECCGVGDEVDAAYDRQFDAPNAAAHLRDYRRHGAKGLTRGLIEALTAEGVDGQTVLEIGAGVGTVHVELLRAGAASAVD